MRIAVLMRDHKRVNLERAKVYCSVFNWDFPRDHFCAGLWCHLIIGCYSFTWKGDLDGTRPLRVFRETIHFLECECGDSNVVYGRLFGVRITEGV